MQGTGQGTGNNLTQRLRAHERRMAAVELRKAGYTYDAIASAVGYTNRGTAYRAIKAALDAAQREAGTELLELELQRLDDMLLGCFARARGGDLFAIDRVVRIAERRAKLLGLDAPAKTQLSGPDGGPIPLDAGGVRARLDQLLDNAAANRTRLRDATAGS